MDIRKFFSVIPKKNNPNPKKAPSPLADSDDDVIEVTPEMIQSKNSHKIKTKRKKIFESSDSEEDIKTNKQKSPPNKKKNKTASKTNLKEINIDEVLSRPVKHSKVTYVPLEENAWKERETKPVTSNVRKSRKNKQTELGIHGDKDFEETLIQLDDEDSDDILLKNMDILDKTIEDADKIYKNTKNGVDQPNKKQDINKSKKSPKKRERTSSESEETPSKKVKNNPVDDDAEMDLEFEKREKKKRSLAMYMEYLHREAPKNKGLKQYPKGKPNCLNNLTFLRTGVLDSLDAEEFQRITIEHGGRVVHGVSKKVNYIVVGEHAGPSKLQKARNYNIKEISEDEFLDLILIKSNMEPKYVNGGGMITEYPDYDVMAPSNKDDGEEINHISPVKSPLASNKVNIVEIETKDADSNKSMTNGNASAITDKPSTKTELKSLAVVAEVKKDSPKKNSEPINKKSTECLSWADKYKPTNLKGVIGQQDSSSNMHKLKRWLENWHKNRKENKKFYINNQFSGDGYRAALLSGPPGVGKTTIATLVAKELNYDIVEFNASDTRSKKMLHEEISQMMEMKSVAGYCAENNLNKKRVLLMDEVDGMAGNEDRGGIAELINFIKKASFPIICMCNDREHQKMRTLVNYCYALKFVRPHLQHTKAAMMSICFKEGVKISSENVNQIIIGTGYDIRQTLNHLSMWSVGEKELSSNTIQKETKNSQKDIVMGPWDVIKKVFNSNEHADMSLVDKSKLFFYDYSLGPLFVQDNYLKVTPNYTGSFSKNKQTEEIIRKSLAADCLSMADVIDSKIRSTNNWSLLDVEAFYCTVFPSCYLSGTLSTVEFPAWFGKNSQRNKNLRIINELYSHTRTSMSGDRFSIRLDYAEWLYKILMKPLLNRGMDGIRDTFDIMKTYNLMKDDLTNMADLFTAFYKQNLYNGVESKVKASLTRLYNKEMTLSFAPTVSKRKQIEESTDGDFGGEEEYSDKETEDTIDDDKLIKIKSKPLKPSTSKKAAPAKKRTTKKDKK